MLAGFQDYGPRLPGTVDSAHGTAASRFGWMSSPHCRHFPSLPSWIQRMAVRASRGCLNSQSRLQTASARSEACWIASNWSAFLLILVPHLASHILGRMARHISEDWNASTASDLLSGNLCAGVGSAGHSG
jgi:hypothetical protein